MSESDLISTLNLDDNFIVYFFYLSCLSCKITKGKRCWAILLLEMLRNDGP